MKKANKPPEPKTINFKDLQFGQAFIFENRLFVKVNPSDALSVSPVSKSHPLVFEPYKQVENIIYFHIKGSAGSTKIIKTIRLGKQNGGRLKTPFFGKTKW